MADYDLKHLARDLRQAANDLDNKVYKELEKSALRVKGEWRDNLEARRHTPTHIPHAPKAITYDTYRLPKSMFVADIGYDKNMVQGPLGNLLEYGSVNNRPGNDGGRALRAEAPRLFAAIADVADIKL